MNWNNHLRQDRPLIFAHRGAMAYRPQNTMPAFALAALQGADGLELDVQLSADGEVVVFHDDTLEKLTDASGRTRDYSWSVLSRFDAGGHFSKDYRGTPMPLLKEVVDNFGVDLLLNIEIKTPSLNAGVLRKSWSMLCGRQAVSPRQLEAWKSACSDLVDATLACLRRGPRGQGMKALKGVIISSFDPAALVLVHERMPELPIALLTMPGPDLVWDTETVTEGLLGKALSAWHPYWKTVDPELVARQTGLGRAVQAWTVNDPEDARRLAALGCRALIGNVPDQLLNAFLTQD